MEWLNLEKMLSVDLAIAEAQENQVWPLVCDSRRTRYQVVAIDAVASTEQHDFSGISLAFFRLVSAVIDDRARLSCMLEISAMASWIEPNLPLCSCIWLLFLPISDILISHLTHSFISHPLFHSPIPLTLAAARVLALWSMVPRWFCLFDASFLSLFSNSSQTPSSFSLCPAVDSPWCDQEPRLRPC